MRVTVPILKQCDDGRVICIQGIRDQTDREPVLPIWISKGFQQRVHIIRFLWSRLIISIKQTKLTHETGHQSAVKYYIIFLIKLFMIF